MSKQTNKEKEATTASLITSPLDDDRRRKMARKAKALTLIIPTEQEDDAITKSALLDPDNPPMTDTELAKLQPARRPRGRPTLAVTKVPTSIRFDSVVLDSFKALGDGWQTLINDVLRQYLVETHQLSQRFHATVQTVGDKQNKLEEFLVVARNTAQAEEKVKQHLLASGRKETALGRVSTVELGDTATRDLPIIM